ncbi:hypothetical protein G6Z94_15100 [Vibrio aestuarianus]|uniref:hypothetical protein n=1 Tax=Vibrio aestuarianus TaxID=28171 RepID=UPI0015940F66|nr:hypothetical protein [Vibrio aestuarianus]NGZ18657.1 hypothetical protein [Vibrio aestuarianus]
MKNKSKISEQDICYKLHAEALACFKNGDNATGVCRMQEARAIEIVRDTGDFSLLLDTVKQNEHELIKMANYFFNNGLETWGGVLAGMTGLMNSISLSGPMADRVKTQKNRESAKKNRTPEHLIQLWKSVIDGALCEFESDSVAWTYESLYQEVVSCLMECGQIHFPSLKSIKKYTPEICERYGFALPSKGKPLTVEFDENILSKVKAVVLNNPQLGAKGVSDKLNEQGHRLDPNKVRLIFKRLNLDSLELRKSYKQAIS